MSTKKFIIGGNTSKTALHLFRVASFDRLHMVGFSYFSINSRAICVISKSILFSQKLREIGSEINAMATKKS